MNWVKVIALAMAIALIGNALIPPKQTAQFVMFIVGAWLILLVFEGLKS